MTTFQDPPYQSRRAVRQSGHVDDVEVDASARPATARTGRRAQLPSSTEWNTDESSSTPGLAETPPAPAPAEPLTLATPLQPQIPVYDSAPETLVADAAPAIPAAPQGRRASLGTGERHPATSAIEAIIVAAPAEAAVVEPAAVEPTPASPEAVVAPVAPQATPSKSSAAPTDRPMTRRELREARVAAERAAGMEEVPEAIVSILNSGPIILPYLSSAATTPLSPEARASSAPAAHAAAVAASVASVPAVEQNIEPTSAREKNALAEFEELTREHEGDAVPIGAEEHPAAPASTWAMPLEPSSVSDAPSSQDIDIAAEPEESEPETAAADEVAADEVIAVVIDEDDDDDVIDASDKAEKPSAITVPEFVEPGQTPVSNRGAGHWSVTPDTDDEIESLENTITRSVGVGSALTTSALVLPSIPQSSDLNQPYTATGETMLTGSIDLPRSLGSTGVHPSQVDNSDFDLDPLDHEVPSTDSAPVRAIRAVSTHTSSNGLITSKKPQGNHMLTVLVVSSSALAVVVVGLLVAGVSSGLFQ